MSEQYHDHTEPIIGCRCAEKYPTTEATAEIDARARTFLGQMFGPKAEAPTAAPSDRLDEIRARLTRMGHIYHPPLVDAMRDDLRYLLAEVERLRVQRGETIDYWKSQYASLSGDFDAVEAEVERLTRELETSRGARRTVERAASYNTKRAESAEAEVATLRAALRNEP